MRSNSKNENKLRILIGEPADNLRRDLTSQLEDAGYSVVAATNDAIHTIQIARALKPDLAILNSALPDTGGLGVARVLRDRGIAPSVILTNKVTPDLIRSARISGVWSVLSGLDHPALIPSIELSTHHWKAERELKERNRLLERSLCTRELVSDAKFLLMDQYGLKEEEAYRRIQVNSMNTRQPMYLVAETILQAHQLSVAS